VTGRAHALKARELLDGIEAFSRELDAMTPEKALELAAAGALARTNADLHWTAELATAHALAAIALQMTDGGETAP